jgi:hypothetical protein
VKIMSSPYTLAVKLLLTILLSSVHLFYKQAGDYIQRRYRIVIRSTMGSIDLYLVR